MPLLLRHIDDEDWTPPTRLSATPRRISLALGLRYVIVSAMSDTLAARARESSLPSPVGEDTFDGVPGGSPALAGP